MRNVMNLDRVLLVITLAALVSGSASCGPDVSLLVGAGILQQVTARDSDAGSTTAQDDEADTSRTRIEGK
jgi:hypothetical protein